MVKAQEWLEENYPNKEQKITKLDVKDKSLEGSLKLEEFTNLKKLDCEGSQLTSLEIVSCPSLEKIYCKNNRLVRLDLNGCPNLKVLYCRNNLLTHLDLSQNRELEDLNIINNNFAEQDLSFVRHLVSLRSLGLGSNKVSGKNIKHGIYNRFIGSLEPLKNLTKLRDLNINNTDLRSGLEYLPDSITYFHFSSNQKGWRHQAKVREIEKELKKISDSGSLSSWKGANPNRVRIACQERKIEQLERQSPKKSSQIAQLEQLKTECAHLKQLVNQQSQILHNPPKQ